MRKYEQVLAGARQVFLSDGFEGASVDDIARAAGVSKATLYSYFSDKRVLFAEMARAECARQAEHAIETIDLNAPAAKVLHQIGAELVDFITSPFGKQIFRISVSESSRFPDLGTAFYESGPLLVRKRLKAFFELAIARGEMTIPDTDFAAEQFHALCKADLLPRMICNTRSNFCAADKQRVVDGAVAMFMARYGTNRTAA